MLICLKLGRVDHETPKFQPRDGGLEVRRILGVALVSHRAELYAEQESLHNGGD